MAFSNVSLAEATDGGGPPCRALWSLHTRYFSLPPLRPAIVPLGRVLLASDGEVKRVTELGIAGVTIIRQAATAVVDLDQLTNASIDLMQPQLVQQAVDPNADLRRPPDGKRDM